MDFLKPLKSLKHWGWVGGLKAKRAWDNTSNSLYDKLVPYSYDPDRYPLSFIRLQPKKEFNLPVGEVPRRVFVIWAGDNPLTANRQAGLRSIREAQKTCEVVLITPDNLAEWILPEHPLPPSFDNLSAVHRADYLRAYLLFHHGGGYSDIKIHHHSWENAFNSINKHPQRWVLGYRIPSVKEATAIDGPMGLDVHRHYTSLLGTGAFIARQGNPIMEEWLQEAERRLLYYSALLEDVPGNAYGDNPGYPIPWTALASQIFEPLCLKYLERVAIDDSIKPQLWGHR